MDLARRSPMTPEPPLHQDSRQLKRKKDKVRSAWISFVGRIVAQIVGAVASVLLGFMVLTKYGLPDRTPAKPAAAPQPASIARPVREKAPRPTGELSLAVLPIQNFSKDAADVYVADGVTEALITGLAQIRGLRVTSRTSSMAYKGTSKPLPEIAKELDTDFILEGSVVRDRGTVRVTAQLIDARTDVHVWARSYDRTGRDLLSLQSDVVTAVVRDVMSALSSRFGLPAAQSGVANVTLER
jgi:TolB-like protein